MNKAIIIVILLLTSLNLYGEDRVETGEDVFFIEEDRVYRQRGEEIIELGIGTELYLTQNQEYLFFYSDFFDLMQISDDFPSDFDNHIYIYHIKNETISTANDAYSGILRTEVQESTDNKFLLIMGGVACGNEFVIFDIQQNEIITKGSYIGNIYWIKNNQLIYIKPEESLYPSPFRPMVDHNGKIYSIAVITISENTFEEEIIFNWTKQYYPMVQQGPNGKLSIIQTYLYKLQVPNFIQRTEDGRELYMPYFWYVSELNQEDFTLIPLDFNEERLVHQTRDVLAQNTNSTRTIGQVLPGMVLDILDVDTESEPPEPGAYWIKIRTESGMEGWCSSLALLSDDWKP